MSETEVIKEPAAEIKVEETKTEEVKVEPIVKEVKKAPTKKIAHNRRKFVVLKQFTPFNCKEGDKEKITARMKPGVEFRLLWWCQDVGGRIGLPHGWILYLTWEEITSNGEIKEYIYPKNW